ncbi:MAG: methionyl-tRNA formyltransferase [Alphaproteobacteria bacterium]|nr:methionyl-tRNA formyltransferase [Alphaproteobacteria bacterium]
MRLAFMGTPQFAVPVLEAVVAHGHEVVCVYSQPPRASGRGHKVQASPVQAAAERLGVPVRVPDSLKGAEEQAAFAALSLDAAVVVAYGLLLPKAVLVAPRLGCFNLHASLLPRWRGAAPIHRAIMAGDAETGVMVMRMEEGLDTGPVLATWRTAIDEQTTTGVLQETLSREGARLMVAALGDLARGAAHEVVQPAEGVTYAKKIVPEEARIAWAKPARAVLAHVHGLNPAPGAWAMLGETRVKILRTRVVVGHGVPGMVIGGPLIVACGEGALEILELQRAGRGVQSAAEFLRGFPVALGTRFV